MFQVVNNLSHQAGAHALRAGVDFLYNDDTITFPRSVRGPYTFSSLAELPGRRLQQRRLHADVRRARRRADQSERRPLRAGRVEGRVQPDAERWACATTCSSSRRSTPTPTTSRRASGSRGRRSASRSTGRARQRRPLLRSRAAARAGQRAAVGRQHDRPDSAAADQRQPVAGAGRARRSSRTSCPRAGAVGHAGQPDDDGPGHAERLLASRRASRSSGSSARSARSASAISTCAGVNLIMSINQNVPSCVAAGTNNGCRPNPDYANNSQYSSAAESNYHGLHVSFVAAAGGVGLLPRELHALEVDEQRRRELLQLADRSVRPRRRTGAGRTTTSGIGSSSAVVNVDGAGETPGSVARLSAERRACRRIRRCRSTSRRASRRFRARRAGRSWTASSSSATPASAATSSRPARG